MSKAAKATWIVGVVLEPGPVCFKEAVGWSLSFSVNPWRELDGPVQRDRLYLSGFPVPENDAQRRGHTRKVPAGATRRLRLRMTKRMHTRRADLLEIGPSVKDAGLESIKKERTKASPAAEIEDEVLGTLELDRRLNWYAGQRRFERRKYSISIEQSSEEDGVTATKAITRARRAIERFEENMTQIRGVIARELLALYNDEWRTDRAKRLDRAKFLKRIVLQSAVISPDGSVQLYFTDGGLFARHSIEVFVNRRGKATDASLAG